METFFVECLNHFNVLNEEIKNSIRDVSGEALDWVPANNTNSINVLVTHLTEAEKYWAVDVVLGKESQCVRSAEFKVRG